MGAVIITLGENGSEYFTKTERIKQEAIKADAVDTTSAGDSYIGAMAVMLDQKNPSKKRWNLPQKYLQKQ